MHMQITPKTRRTRNKGYALLLTMIFLAIALIACSSVMYWSAGNAKITGRNNQFNTSEAAAEAAIERALAQMNRDFTSQSLTNASFYQTLLPVTTNAGNVWPIQYTFSDTNGNSGAISVNLGPPATNTTPLNSQYSGLYGLAQNCTITATATPIGQQFNIPATIAESLQFASIPLFQFAIFYNVNMEICPGQPMTVSGPVYCNQSIWAGSGNLTFSSTVSAVGTNCLLQNDPFALNYGPQTPPASFSISGQPTANNDAITMPIGTNNNPAVVRGILDLPPTNYAMGTAAAYSTNGQYYLANEVDLYITNSARGTNFGTIRPSGTNNTIIYFQDSKAVPYLTRIVNDYYIITNWGLGSVSITNYYPPNKATNIVYAGYSFITNVVFYDWREGWNGGSGPAKKVQAVQIDMGKFSTWLTNATTNSIGISTGGAQYNGTCVTDKGHSIDSIYVWNSVPLSGTTLPAVRLANGGLLPDPSGARYGFTLATKYPVYVKGNYNSQDTSSSASGSDTTHTYPAAIMADAITILSTSWSDVTTSVDPSSGNTTVNAAMLEGIVQTDPTISGDYSGGTENFLRLLENWSGHTLTYNGSIVVMFYSQFATNHWSGGGYYGVPTRAWAFDANFRQQSKLPPLTPQSKAIIRGQWNASP